jgi:NAD(P)-dependent dehydrogenase (short-subunit alcohol dehydrogenase family)
LLNFTSIDVLVNNAGIADTRIDGQSSFAKLNAVFATNAAGPFATTEAFAPLLAKSNGTPRIVNVSTGGSSITMKMDPKNEFRSIQAEAYRISKAAMNMATACQVEITHSPITSPPRVLLTTDFGHQMFLTFR